MVCGHCGRQNPEGARFCLKCGEGLRVVCPQCGADLPPEPDLHFCFSCGFALDEKPTPPARTAPGPADDADEDRRLVTVLFADLAGWTRMASAMDPEDVQAIQRAYFDAVTPPIQQQGGRVEKYVGDAVLAVFGVPQAHEDDPERAVCAALAMQEAIAALNDSCATWAAAAQDPMASDSLNLLLRIGVHTGLVLSRFDEDGNFVVIGDTVNLASRLEGAAPPGGLLVSHDTYRHVQHLFDVEALPPLAVKGKPEPVKTYLVTQARPRPVQDTSRGVAGVQTRMVGREAELLALQGALQDVTEDRELRLITLVGEAGVGKSRLILEFMQWADDLPQDLWYYRGRARPSTERQPYCLLRNMLAARFGIAENDALAAVRHKLENGISRVEAGTWRLNAGGPALDVLSSKIGLESLAREIQRSVHLIGHLVGYDYSDSAAVQPLQDNPRQLREQALRALATYFEKLAALTPIIVVLEDLHWADDSSLDALNQLAQALAGTPILVLAAARPRLYRRRPHWGEGWAFSSRLDLHPLSKRSSRKLVYEILQRADEIPENLETLVVSGAEGNPFYVEELIKMLIDDRVIATGAGRWQIDLDQLRHARVPVTLTGVLQARLDRLPPEERTVLQQASVVGSVFWDRAVLACGSEHDAGEKESLRALRATLSALRAREFVAQRESSTFENTTELTFKHAVLRDVTYESVLKRLRRLYHGLVADWLMDQAGERLSEYAGLISEHLALAGRCDEAACYLLETGDRARLRYAQREAVEHYEQALTIIEAQGDDDRTARILMRLGLAHHSASQFEAARQSFDRANQLWHETRRPPSVATAASAPHALRLPMMPPVSMDPGHLEASPGSSPCITDHLFSGLVGWDATGRIVPDLAERWQELDGGLVYLFQLRDDASWSDGRPVTAEDFVHAFQRLLHPANSGRLGLLPLIKDAQAYHQRQITAFGEVGVSAPDPLTLRIELAQPAGHLLHLLAQVYPVPRHVVAEHGEAWTDLRHLVTNGPFRLEEWHEGRRLALQRNPSYHHRFPGNIDQVLLVLEEDPDAWLQAYEADELDAVRLLNLAPAALEQARQRHVAEYRLAPDLRTGYIGFALNRPPFDDLRVRLAFGLAADMETVAHVLFGGAFLPATGGFLPPGMPGHSPGIGLGYDPGRACQLLAEAGYPSARGFPRLTASVPHGALSVVEAIAAQWRDVLEVEVDCQAVDLGQGSDRVGRGQAQLWGGEMSATCPDPQEFSLAESPCRWENERYLALLERAGRTADQAARQDLYRQADCLVIQEAPILPCYYGITHLLVKPWVRRFTSFWRSWHEVIIDQH